MEAFLVACRAVQYVSAMLAFGVAAFPIYAVAGSDSAAVTPITVRLRGLLLASAVVAFLSALVLVPVTGSRMAGSAAAALDPHTIAVVLFRTSFGQVWCGHLLIALLLIAASVVRHVRSGYRATLAALFLATIGWVGHATIGEGQVRLAHEINDSVHLLAGGIWLGGLVPLAVLIIRVRRTGDTASLMLLREALPQFSHMGYVAVGLVALTGIVNAILLVGSLDGLTGTAYGRLLLIKIALFLLLVAVAGINRFALAPLIAHETRRPAGTAALMWMVGIEQTLGLGILVVVSVLGTWPPAMHMHYH